MSEDQTTFITRGDELRERRMGGIVPTQRAVSLEDLPEEKQDLERIKRGEFTSEQIKDPFATWQGQVSNSKINEIKPPFNFAALLRMAIDNSVLKQCIEAMVTNISGHGHRLEYIGPEEGSETPEAVKEAKAIEAFIAHPNDEYSLAELRKRVRWDMEAMGNAYIEVARNRKGQISAMWHLPGHLVRLTEVDKEQTTVEVELPRFDGLERRKIKKNFRRFVQIRGMNKVYFKEFGDPRPINPADGSVDATLAFEDSATEVIHLKLYHAGYAYGLPRWINNLVAIQGSRQAELTNLDYFSENAIPAMMILVSGGSLTQQTMTMLEQHVTSLRGRKAANRVMFVEAYGDEHAKGDDGTIPPPKIDVKPMGGERPKEGMFLEYDKAQTEKVRSSFRLPPIFLGLSEDYTHATANTSYDVGEGQVFGPERVTEDDLINNHVLKGYNLKFWEFRSNPPRITDPNEALEAVKAFDEVGAMTPNTAIGIANEMFDLDIERIKEDWGNLPYTTVETLIASGNLEMSPEGKLVYAKKPDPVAPASASPAASGDKKPAATKKSDDENPDDRNKAVRSAMMTLRDTLLNEDDQAEEVARLSAEQAVLQFRSRRRALHPAE